MFAFHLSHSQLVFARIQATSCTARLAVSSIKKMTNISLSAVGGVIWPFRAISRYLAQKIRSKAQSFTLRVWREMAEDKRR
jgi:hypothetical protein